jgi:hypothetical protein
LGDRIGKYLQQTVASEKLQQDRLESLKQAGRILAERLNQGTTEREQLGGQVAVLLQENARLRERGGLAVRKMKVMEAEVAMMKDWKAATENDMVFLRDLAARLSGPFLRVDVDAYLVRVKGGQAPEEAIKASATFGHGGAPKNETQEMIPTY